MNAPVPDRMNLNRRMLITGAATALSACAAAPTAMGSPTTAMAGPSISPPRLEFAFRVFVTIGKPTELGTQYGMRKRMIPITGGTFTGPRVSGIVLPGGEDWQDVRPDGTAQILALYSLRADDGTSIMVKNPGYRHAPPEILEKLARGEDVDPSLYYFRTSPSLSVPEDSPHAWMGKTVFTCTAARYAADVILDYYAVL